MLRAMAVVVAGATFLSATVRSAEQPAKQAEPQLWLAPGIATLPVARMGPFVSLADGGVLTVDGTASVVSRDDGATWDKPVSIAPSDKFQISNERMLLKKRNGTIVLACMNLKTRTNKEFWDPKTHDFTPGMRLDVWSARTTDAGKTWTDVGCVQEGYAGAVRALVEARDGTIVLATQTIARNPARHVVTAYTSKNDGKSWQRSAYVDADGKRHDVFDLGGHGHHDGAIEPTVIPLQDGRLWMLIRTAKDSFWETFSADSGATWTDFRSTKIAASAAPGMLHRLADGRLLLAYNQLYPEGRTEYARKGPEWHAVPASYHREELSISFSSDEGATWSKPTVIARKAGAWLSYPYLFEPRPGEIWLTTMQGGLRLRFAEKDFLP